MTSRQRRVAELRAMGFTQEAAADLMGLGVRTLQRDEADPAVAAEILRLEESGQSFRPEIVALRRALLATKRVNGQEVADHYVRVMAAAKLIAAMPVPSPAPENNGQSVVHIHVTKHPNGETEIRPEPTPGLLDYEGALALEDDQPD